MRLLNALQKNSSIILLLYVVEVVPMMMIIVIIFKSNKNKLYLTLKCVTWALPFLFQN